MSEKGGITMTFSKILSFVLSLTLAFSMILALGPAMTLAESPLGDRDLYDKLSKINYSTKIYHSPEEKIATMTKAS